MHRCTRRRRWLEYETGIEHVNELGTSRALYRGGLFLLVIFIVALILHELVWVLVQLFVASIIAAAMTPIVRQLARQIPGHAQPALAAAARRSRAGRVPRGGRGHAGAGLSCHAGDRARNRRAARDPAAI